MEENTEVITDEKEKLEKLYQIDFKAKKISEELKDTNKPIFIELVGTPKSGKTTLKNSLEEIFKRNNVNFYLGEKLQNIIQLANHQCIMIHG